MAGVIGFRPVPTSPSIASRSVSRRPSLYPSVRASSDLPSSSSSSSSSATEEKRSLSPPPGFKPPKPKRFAVRGDKVLDVLGASLALPFRLGTGVFVSGYSAAFVSDADIPPGQYALRIAGLTVKETSKLGPRPEKPIEIYEFEGCPFCRKVREIVSILDLDVLYYPCPRNGPQYRYEVLKMGGKQQFPYMVDPNTGVSMYESDEIIKYLVQKYGDGSVPSMLSLGLLTTLTAGLAMIGRFAKGSSYTPARPIEKPIEVWAYEGSPFCKLVREVLVEHELPHLMHCVARGSPRRQELFERVGNFQVPYIEDPNTGVKMFESAEIIDYLKATYAI
ncbi:thioredoxin family protein [Wolffia australiana]